MSQLVQIRQRIKAIETIQKVTHAMRLIAMSNHNHLRSRYPIALSYQQELAALMQQVHKGLPADHVCFPSEKEATEKKNLLILVGSQKGLCGTFNNFLFRFFQNYLDTNAETFDIIVVGKRAVDFIQKKTLSPVISIENLSQSTLDSSAKQLAAYVAENSYRYNNVIAFRNLNHGIFSQIPEKLVLYPFPQAEATNDLDQYIFEEPIANVASTLCYQTLQATMSLVLFQSLFAEQAARFQSMDSATRNAQDLLDLTMRNYNKLRQAKITKELTELVSSFCK